jgi:hypothetical protein
LYKGAIILAEGFSSEIMETKDQNPLNTGEKKIFELRLFHLSTRLRNESKLKTSGEDGIRIYCLQPAVRKIMKEVFYLREISACLVSTRS